MPGGYEYRHPSRGRLELRITLSRLDAVFEACDKLPHADKELLFKEIANRVRQYAPQCKKLLPRGPLPLRQAKTLEEFVDRSRQLADSAPNDKVRNALLMIVRALRQKRRRQPPASAALFSGKAPARR
jgi:hypothetical protein